MNHPYEDILDRPYTGIRKHKQMAMVNRGAQFSPFAALTGYEEAIRETGRLTLESVELGQDAIGELDQKLKILQLHQEENPWIEASYFVSDDRKSGGKYWQIRGQVRKVEPEKGRILLLDGCELQFRNIRTLSTEVDPV